MLGSDGNTALAGARGVIIVTFPLVLMKRLNKTAPAVFLNCRFSLFLRDPFFQII